MKQVFLALALAILPAYVWSAAARHVEVLGESIAVPIPVGYCEVGSHPIEAEIVRRLSDGVGNTNLVLAVFADCAEAAEVRRGTRATFDNYGQVMVPTPDGKLRKFPDGSRAEYLDLIGVRAGRGLPGAVERGAERAKIFVPGLQVQESLGVLATDTNGLYFGFLASIPDTTGKQKSVLGITGMTLVKAVPVSVNVYRAYSKSPELQAQLAREREAVAGLVRANE